MATQDDKVMSKDGSGATDMLFGGKDTLASGSFNFSLLEKEKSYKLSFRVKLKHPGNATCKVKLCVKTTRSPIPIPRVVEIDPAGGWQDAETAFFVATGYGSVDVCMVNISGTNIELLIDHVKFIPIS